jgi:hypothetical protein
MENRKHDLRDELGKAREDGNTNAKMAGHTDKVMPIDDSGQHVINPGPGSRAGMAEGQVTKSN